MKVLFILSSNIMGGATISILNLIKNLEKNNIVPVVVIPSQCKKDDLEDILTINNIEYHHTLLYESVLPSLNIKNSLKWVAKYVVLYFQKKKSAKKLDKLIKNIKPDIIHTNVGIIHEGFHLALKYNIPHVWHLREYQTLDFNWYIYPSYKKFCSYLKESYVITITEAIKNYFKLDKYKRAITIYNGIFCQKERPLYITKDKYFLMASRISREKGHADVIKAFSYFSKRNEYKLIIAGFGKTEYIEELKSLARYYGCENRIVFLGFQNDIKPLMLKAKALVVASYNEGFGRMTAEAAFCATLVLGRNTAGTKEIMDKTGGMSFITNEDMVAQMEAVSSMSEYEYTIKAQKAQAVAVENYSVENNVRRTCEFYHSIVHNRNSYK